MSSVTLLSWSLVFVLCITGSLSLECYYCSHKTGVGDGKANVVESLVTGKEVQNRPECGDEEFDSDLAPTAKCTGKMDRCLLMSFTGQSGPYHSRGCVASTDPRCIPGSDTKPIEKDVTIHGFTITIAHKCCSTDKCNKDVVYQPKRKCMNY
ncbi:uncharacterized protein LOC135494422 [Lineus longissimus]|uniref:uncharacterized protein LOC135494422 n=1 Tax=Lineus longissimus TaxID=88925 RepID=UPI002B4D605E